MIKYFTLLISFTFVMTSLSAQNENSANFQLGLTYGMQIPGADMAESFGQNLNIGASLPIMTKNGFLFGLDGYYIFGSRVKEDVLENLRTREGEILGIDRTYANVSIRQRGMYAGGFLGKVFPIGKEGYKHGLRIQAGAGFFMHKIRIDDSFGSVPMLKGEYLKGYDRLTYGYAFNEFIGYQYMSDNQLVNFFIGLEFTQGITQNQRNWDFYTNQAFDEQRMDLLWGFKVGWFLPFYINDKPEAIRYY